MPRDRSHFLTAGAAKAAVEEANDRTNESQSKPN
jgi:hypothetical protein